MMGPLNTQISRGHAHHQGSSPGGESAPTGVPFLRGLLVGASRLVSTLLLIGAGLQVLYAIGWAWGPLLRRLDGFGPMPSTPWIMASDAAFFLLSTGAAFLMLLGLVLLATGLVARLGGWRGKAPWE